MNSMIIMMKRRSNHHHMMRSHLLCWLLYMSSLPVGCVSFIHSFSTTAFLASGSSSSSSVVSRRERGCSTSSILLYTPVSSGGKHTMLIVSNHNRHVHRHYHQQLWAVDPESLMDMDVVIYSEKTNDDNNDNNNDEAVVRRLAAVQEDGSLTPLSAWTNEPAFGTSIEFLVDEEDRFPSLETNKIIIHRVLSQDDNLSYGSRQVGGGMGPGNPHGEESELLYYIEQDLLKDIEYDINPDLEIFW